MAQPLFAEFIFVLALGIICSVIFLLIMSRIFQNLRNPTHRCSLVVGVSLLAMFFTLFCFFPEAKRMRGGGNRLKPTDVKRELIGKLRDELRFLNNYPILESDLRRSVGAFETGRKWRQPPQTKLNMKCIKRPQIADILINNQHWQVLSSASAKENKMLNYYIFGAYLDTRGKPRVRISVIRDRSLGKNEDKNNQPKFCQFWYANESRVEVGEVVSTLSPWIWGHGGQQYHPYIITCNLPKYVSKMKRGPTAPKAERIPISVSLVMNKCDTAMNNVQITYNVPKGKKDIGICFKMLDFPTQSFARRIIEMVELLKILGVGGVHFPYLAVDDETMKVLKYYEATGFVTLKAFSLPGHQLNLPITRHAYLTTTPGVKRKQELIPYNDCFLSNIYRYKIIGVLDMDEVLLPTTDVSYQDIVREYWGSKYTSYCFKMKQFLEEIVFSPNETVVLHRNEPIDPQAPEMTNHVFFDKVPVCNERRSRGSKCFHRTDNVLLVHNHYPLKCVEEKSCKIKDIPMEQAYIHHHRGVSEYCQYNAKTDPQELILNPFEYDPLIQNYTVEIMNRRDFVLSQIQNWNFVE